MTIYLAGQPFCVCLVSCCDLQPESRGVFLKGIEEMQALSSLPCLLAVSCQCSTRQPSSGEPPTPSSCPHSVRYSFSQSPQSFWPGLTGSLSLWLSVPLALGAGDQGSSVPGKGLGG